MNEFDCALRPVLGAGSDLGDRVVAELKMKIEAIERQYSALTLLDTLTVQQRTDLNRTWSLAATIVTPAPGSGSEKLRSSFVRDLIQLARRLLMTDTAHKT